MTKVKDTFYRHVLSVLLVIVYVAAQVVHSLKFIEFSNAFLVDLRSWAWISITILLGVEAIANTINIYRNFLNNKIQSNNEEPK